MGGRGFVVVVVVVSLRFQAGCRKRRLNLDLVFCVYFLRCSTFLLIGECVLLLC